MDDRQRAPALLAAAAAALATLCLALVVIAAPPVPKGGPKDRVEIGDVFVEAWLSFRDDLDTLSHGHLNPTLLESWLDQAPRFLLRDASRLATAPTVVSAALERLRSRENDEDRALFASILARYRGTPVGYKIWGGLILAGHRISIDEADALLKDPNLDRRIEAARALAAAGERRGMIELRKILSSGEPHHRDLAALTLGEFGGRQDQRALEAEVRRDEDFDAAAAALGEIRLRRVFSAHHKMLIRRDPLGQRFETSSSLYVVWLKAIRTALESGAEDSTEMIASIEAQRKAAAGDTGEVLRRQLKSLVDFWERTDAALRATPGDPRWPSDFATATARMAGVDPRHPEPADLADRVSSAISICSWAAGEIDHESLFSRGAPYAAVTPGGDRMADFNLATSWRGIQGEAVVVDLEAPTRIRSIDIAQSCEKGTGGWIESISVSATGEDGSWKISRETGREGLYFRKIDVGGKTAERLTITLERVHGDHPACIGELRIR